MPDYGSGTFLLSNIANSSSHSQGSGSEDVFQWNPGDGAPVEDHDADAGASIRDGTSNTVLLAEDHLPAVQGVGTATDTDWLLV